jgi:hypothetical protein
MVFMVHGIQAQRSLEEIRQALIGQPLYLRGFWIANKLEFDGAGHLRNASEKGPLTLSGVDVREVSLNGTNLVLQARRAALVSNREGRLMRRSIYSTTHIEFSLLPSPLNKYIAYREVTVMIRPDSSGSFDTALSAVFANGLAELGKSVPPYWRCYAEGYFIQDVNIVDARKTAAACIAAHSLSIADRDRGKTGSGFTPAKILSTVQPQFSTVAAELGINAVSHVRFTVSQHGIPVGFQIMRAAGGGMDAETLLTVAAYKFQPAQRNGKAVPADLDVDLQYSVSP